MRKKMQDAAVPSLPYRFKKDKAALLSFLLPGIPCFALVIWLCYEKVWQGLLIFLPILFALISLFAFYASRSLTLQHDKILLEGIFSSRSEYLYEDIKKVDIFVGGKTRFLTLQLNSSSHATKLSLTPFSNHEWRKLIQVLDVNAPNITIGSVAARLLKGELYY